MQNEKRGYDGCFFTKVKSPFRTKDHEIATHDGDLKTFGNIFDSKRAL